MLKIIKRLRKASMRTKYTLCVTLDGDWCRQHGVKAGSDLLMFVNPNKPSQLIIEIPKNKRQVKKWELYRKSIIK